MSASNPVVGANNTNASQNSNVATTNWSRKIWLITPLLLLAIASVVGLSFGNSIVSISLNRIQYAVEIWHSMSEMRRSFCLFIIIS